MPSPLCSSSALAAASRTARIRIAQSLDQQRHRALVGDLRQLKHGHAPHSGVVVRAARGDIVEIGIERVEQSHWRAYRSR